MAPLALRPSDLAPSSASQGLCEGNLARLLSTMLEGQGEWPICLALFSEQET
jgi:hypothetical protein